MLVSFHPTIGGELHLPIDPGRGDVGIQVFNFIHNTPYLLDTTEVLLPADPAAAILVAAALYHPLGLVTIARPPQPSLPLRDVQLRVGRQRPDPSLPWYQEAAKLCYVLNASGTLFNEVRGRRLASGIGVEVEHLRLVDLQVTFAPENPIPGAVESVLALGANSNQWALPRFFLVPPGDPLAAVLVATVLFGLRDQWPGVLKISGTKITQVRVQDLCESGRDLFKDWRIHRVCRTLEALAEVLGVEISTAVHGDLVRATISSKEEGLLAGVTFVFEVADGQIQLPVSG